MGLEASEGAGAALEFLVAILPLADMGLEEEIKKTKAPHFNGRNPSFSRYGFRSGGDAPKTFYQTVAILPLADMGLEAAKDESIFKMNDVAILPLADMGLEVNNLSPESIQAFQSQSFL